LPEVISPSPFLMADTLVAAALNRSTVFAAGSSIGYSVIRFNRFCTTHAAFSLHITLGRPIFHKNLLLPVEGSVSPSNTSFLGSTRTTTPKDISVQSAASQNTRSLPTGGRTNRLPERRWNSTCKNRQLTLYARRG